MKVLDPFSLFSLYAGGPDELTRYTQGAALLSDDRMALEFSAPRELHQPDAQDNSAAILALLDPERAPAAVRDARAKATAAAWRNRGAMLAKSDVYGFAYDDYVKALQMDPSDQGAIDGLVDTAILTRRSVDALSWLIGVTVNTTPSVPVLIARSKLLAASGSAKEALDIAMEAAARTPVAPAALEQLAALYADAGRAAELDAVVERLRATAPDRAATSYFAGVAAFLHGRAADAVSLAERAVSIDPQYAAVYDLLGAAHTRSGRPDQARRAFASSLAINAHDSTAYVNLGMLAMAEGHRDEAANYFAEALWLTPESAEARQGLSQALP
jgi:Flp pilus assembly protein TadD